MHVHPQGNPLTGGSHLVKSKISVNVMDDNIECKIIFWRQLLEKRLGRCIESYFNTLRCLWFLHILDGLRSRPEIRRGTSGTYVTWLSYVSLTVT